ncbi:MAG TPA: hypothetical protein VIP57_17185, partial [Candidatus Dormibacteraeota bacterium]
MVGLVGFAELAPAGARAWDAVAAAMAALGGGASPLPAAPSPFRACAELGERRRRRRLGVPAGR